MYCHSGLPTTSTRNQGTRSSPKVIQARFPPGWTAAGAWLEGFTGTDTDASEDTFVRTSGKAAMARMQAPPLRSQKARAKKNILPHRRVCFLLIQFQIPAFHSG